MSRENGIPARCYVHYASGRLKLHRLLSSLISLQMPNATFKPVPLNRSSPPPATVTTLAMSPTRITVKVDSCIQTDPDQPVPTRTEPANEHQQNIHSLPTDHAAGTSELKRLASIRRAKAKRAKEKLLALCDEVERDLQAARIKRSENSSLRSDGPLEELLIGEARRRDIYPFLSNVRICYDSPDLANYS